MRYWQFTTRRMSRAVQKLEMDGAWHTFQSAEHSIYRVWNKKIVQRATFKDDAEEELLRPSIVVLEPLPDMAQTTGFREELRIELIADKLWMVQPLGYPLEPEENANSFERALAECGIRAMVLDGLLANATPVLEIERACLLQAIELGYAVRGLYNELKNSIGGAQPRALAQFLVTIKAIVSQR